MPGPLTPVTFDFTGTRQDKNDRKIQQGELTELKNYRRTEEGSLEKRLAFHSTETTTLHGTTYTGPCTEVIPSNSLIFLDSLSQVFHRDASSGEGHYRGTLRRAFPTWYSLENRADAAIKPLMVRKGNELWVFSLGCSANGNDAYQLTVTTLSGTVLRETEAIEADGIVSYAACLGEDNYVWLAYVNGVDGEIISHVYFDYQSAPDIAVYDDETGAVFNSVDMVSYPDQPYILLAALSAKDSGGDRISGAYYSYASTAGQVATGSSFATSTCTGGAGIESTTGISILVHDVADGFFHAAYFRTDPSDDDFSQLILDRVTALTPATVTQAVLASFEVPDTYMSGVCSGHVDLVSGNRVVNATFAALNGADSSFAGKNNLTVSQYEFDGATSTPGPVVRSASVASKPFLMGDSWYYLSHFDDDDGGTVGTNLQIGAQNSYFVRTMDGKLVTSILDGEAGVFSFGSLNTGSATFSSFQQGSLSTCHVVTPVVVDSTHISFPLLDAGIVRTRPGRSVATVDFAPAYRSSADGIALGGLPARVSERDAVTELSPVHSPYAAWSVAYTTMSPAPLSLYLTYLYCITDEDGNVHRSAPYPVNIDPWPPEDVDLGDMPLTLPTLRHVYGDNVVVDIELYGSATGPDGLATSTTVYLQDSIKNDPTVDSVTLTINPRQWSTGGEVLYSTNGIPNIAPVPARIAWQQGNRTMLGGTPSGEIWPSHEQRPGSGPEFNPALNFLPPRGFGELTAGVGLAADSSVLFSATGIAIATGNPDGRGSGGWSIDRLKTKKGTVGPVCEGPLGVYFQNAEDGRMCLLANGAVSEIHQGMESYSGYTFTAAVDCPDERCIRWFAINGKQLVLDYSKPLADQGAGTWHLHESDALPAAVGAGIIDGACVMLEAGDEITARQWQPSAGVTDADFLDDGTEEVLTDAVTGRMGLNGPQGEFDSDWVTLSSTHLGGDSTYQYDLIPDSGVAEEHPDVASEDADVTFRTGCMRTRGVRLRIQETSATGRGRKFDGVTIEVRPGARIKRPYRQVG